MAKSSTRGRRGLIVSAVACLMVVGMTVPALADSHWWTDGKVVTTAEGAAAGYSVDGKIRMVRFTAGKQTTIAEFKGLTGFVSRKKYPAVVRTGTCSSTPVGGPEFGGFAFSVTADRDGNIEDTGHYNGIADTTARAVVIYDYDGSGTAIACANLK